MGKRYNKVVLMFLFPMMFALTSCSTDVHQMQAESDDSETMTADIPASYPPDLDFELAFPDSIQDEAERFALEVQGSFVPADYEDTIIPAELITAAQKALFDRTPHEPALVYSSPEIDREEFYSSPLSKNPSGDANITDTNHIYKYDLGKDSYYLFVIDSRGTARLVDIAVYRESEESLEYWDHYLSLDLDAKVIQYQGNFYLLQSSYNYYTKYTDTVTLCELTPRGIGHCVSSCQVPASYEREIIYENSGTYKETVTNYVDSVMDDLMAASPINDNIRLFTGDERPVADDDINARLKSVGKDFDYYEIDFNNDGKLEYISRHYWYPCNSTCLYLISNIYRFSPERIVELDCELAKGNGELVQVWFKELDDKIFTFRLFAFQDKYILNVSLTEDARIAQLQTWLIVPQNKFEVESWEHS